MISAARRAASKFFWNRNPYDSVKSPGTRQPPQRQTASEDWMVTDLGADCMSTRVRNLYRNFALAAWVIRKHVDYLADWRFEAKTPNQDEFNTDVNQFMMNWSSRFNCDALRKHSLQGIIWLMECSRVVDGDVFILKVAGNGPQRGSLQLIESQRVRTPQGVQTSDGMIMMPSAAGLASTQRISGNFLRGIRLTSKGIASGYAVHKRGGDSGSFIFERVVPSTQMIQHAYYQRPDQYRGISPLNSAANAYRDLYESQTYALAGIKAAQMVGLVIKQQYEGNNFSATYEDPMSDRNDKRERLQQTKWGPRPEVLILGQGDDASFIDSHKPSSETASFMRDTLHLCIKGLDIPISFWDESQANYSSMRSARIEYNAAQKPNKRTTKETLDEITKWRLGMAIADGDLTLPAGVEFDDMVFDWEHVGKPMIDPQKEARAAEDMIALGLTNPYAAAAMMGGDYETNVQLTNRALEYAESVGDWTPRFADSSTAQSPSNADDSSTSDDDEEGADNGNSGTGESE